MMETILTTSQVLHLCLALSVTCCVVGVAALIYACYVTVDVRRDMADLLAWMGEREIAKKAPTKEDVRKATSR